jgi:SAM-dependent methyltransferase
MSNEAMRETIRPGIFWRMLQPVAGAITAIAPGVQPRLQIAANRVFYSVVSILLKGDDTAFLNYGYAPADANATRFPLEAADEADRQSIQLYLRVLAGADLRGKAVLEVGCGRGGGASFIARYLAPASMTGIDLSERAAKYCRRRHRHPNLRFIQGDAQDLPVENASYDVVLNVESSHCYPDFDRFLAEVRRALRPAGRFLFADIRPRENVDVLRRQLAAQFSIVEEERITPNVLLALNRDSDRRSALIHNRAPKFMHAGLKNFAGVEGSVVFAALEAGDLQYVRFVLQKNARPGD